jgi:hypothetical protein
VADNLRHTPLDRETVLETARKLFAHYGWSNEKDLEMRDRIEKMRDMALASIASESTLRLAPPTEDEVAAYRNLFRAELDKRMDTNHPSASPSTEAHQIALTRFVDARNAKATK